MINPTFGVAVFPFLKTSGPIRIGAYTFRSTTDVADLPTHQANAVAEIAQMLFVQGDLRVRSASYSIIPSLEINGPNAALEQLVHLRAVLAYLYAAPHEIFGDVFLAPEEVSLALFIPDKVSVFLTRPEHHTERIGEAAAVLADAHHNVPGYRGVYNFLHYFWLEPGSRLYGPKPHITLNISQDLQHDLAQCSPQSHLLLELLERPITPSALRIYSALHWFNAASEKAIDPDRALLNLAVAFEALLKLPDSSKTDRLVDAIALLLGRTERLDDWAGQFYAARSRVAHEGRLADPYFYAPVDGKPRQRSGLFGSLMLYGRQIFRLCLGTLLVGMDLAERADLQEKFTTNNERYQKICEVLKAETSTPLSRLLGIEPTIQALKRYHFVASGLVLRGPLIVAVSLAAKTLGECGCSFEDGLASSLAKCAASKREDGELVQLAAIEQLDTAFKNHATANVTQEANIVLQLVDIAWMSVFPYYYWLKEQHH